MKKLFLIITMMLAMGNGYAMTDGKTSEGGAYPKIQKNASVKDSEQVFANVYGTLAPNNASDDSSTQLLATEMSQLSLNAGQQGVHAKHDEKEVKKEDKDNKQYQDYLARINSDYKKVEVLFQEIIDAKIPANFPADLDAYNSLVKTSRAQLKKRFADLSKKMGKRWPCSPIWIALEMVIKSKQEGEDEHNKQLYDRRLAVLEHVAQRQTYASLPLRKYQPDSCCWFLTGLCCVPCVCMTMDVEGQPIHYAAKMNNVDALKIFIPILEARHTGRYKLHTGRYKLQIYNYLDDCNWSPLHYAAYFNAKDAFAYLAQVQGKFSEDAINPCYTLESLTTDPQIKRVITTTLRGGR